MPKSRLALLVLLVALVAGGLFFLTRTLDGGAASGASAAPAAAERASAPVANTAELAVPASTDSAARADVRAPAAALGSESTREENFALDGAHWLSGRVKVPAGAPPDETLAVWALDLDGGEHGSRVMFGNSDDPAALLEPLRDEHSTTRWAHRLVTSDGTFRVPVPADSGHAVLVLDGRYLYLDERVDVDLAHPAAELVLEAQLGAWLVVRCTPPPGAASADLAERGDGAVGGFSMSGGKNGGRFVQRKATLDAACGFESRGLPPLKYGVSVAPRRFASARARDVDAAAGKKVELELVLTRGATVRGRVLDESGAAIASAAVHARAADRGRGGMMDWTTNLVGERRGETAADGSFELAALSPGKVDVRVERTGFVGGGTGELDLADGVVLADVVVKLSRGGGVAGTVTFPDGKPAAHASVTVYPVQAEKKRRGMTFGDESEKSRSGATEADGSFAITGLGAGPYRVAAHYAERDADTPSNGASSAGETAPATREPVSAEPEADAPLTSLTRGIMAAPTRGTRIDAHVWLATRDDVAANTQTLALVLQPPPGLAGRVVDEKGAPIRRFIVSAAPEWGKDEVLDRSVHAVAVEGESGTFALAGVPAGTWRVSIEADGYVQAGEKPLAVVPLAQELVVTLGSAGSIRGTVVDPLGQPVAKARVTRHASGDKSPWGGMGREDGATTDAQGAFEIKEVSAGAWELNASADAWAKSAAVPVTVESGAEVSGIVVTLRRGGTIEGEVFAAAGEHVAGRTVQMFSMEASDMRSANVDEKQRFTAEHVTPGAYQVMLQPDASALEAMSGTGGEEANPADFLSKMKMTSCTVVEGETTHVVLGAPPKNPVRVFGRITRGGEPVTKCALVVLNEGADMMQNLRFGKVDADGRYEVTLNLPGDVVFVVGKQMGDNSGVEFPLTIPEVAEYQCDLALPSGGIHGTVRGSDGRPLANVSVELARDHATGVMMMGGMPSESTDEAGRYAFDDLHAGTYTVAAGGSRAQMFGGGAAAENGRSLRAGLVVDGEKPLDGIDFVLGGAGTIAGVVQDARGKPISGAVVFARDAGGELVHRLSGISSDAAGKFTYPGLAEGRYTLFARAQALAGRESHAVEVRAGETASVELALDAGTVLVITLTDADDKPLRASLSVVDEHGREMSQAVSLDSVMATMTKGVNTREQRFGPLPAGKYVVTARTSDGKSAKKSVSLSGQDERKLRVRVD